MTLEFITDYLDRKIYENYSMTNNIEDRVKFIGKKENPYPYMKDADYIVLTSDYEGFPVTYLEALTLNKQIITTINTSDESINMKDYANIISKDPNKMVKEVKEILKSNRKYPHISVEKLQKDKIKTFEKLFNGEY